MKILMILFMLVISMTALAVPTAVTVFTPTETADITVFVDVDDTNGNEVKNAAGDVILIFENPGLSSATATVNVQVASITVPGFGAVTKASVSCVMATLGHCVVGPFTTRQWNDGNSKLQITYSGAGSADINIIALKP